VEVAGPDRPDGAVVRGDLVDERGAVPGRGAQPQPRVPELDPGVVGDRLQAVCPRRPAVRRDDEAPRQLDRRLVGAGGRGRGGRGTAWGATTSSRVAVACRIPSTV